jgi:hypothetical protein
MAELRPQGSGQPGIRRGGGDDAPQEEEKRQNQSEVKRQEEPDMIDRTTKLLLVAIALGLWGLLLQPLLRPTPIAAGSAAAAQPVWNGIAADGRWLYVLRGDVVDVYDIVMTSDAREYPSLSNPRRLYLPKAKY